MQKDRQRSEENAATALDLSWLVVGCATAGANSFFYSLSGRVSAPAIRQNPKSNECSSVWLCGCAAMMADACNHMAPATVRCLSPSLFLQTSLAKKFIFDDYPRYYKNTLL
jgi:predicted ferric reductase